MWNLDEAVDWRRPGSLILVKDSVSVKGTFLLHHLLKSLLDTRAKSPADSGGGKVVFVGLADPFPHYSRVARKQGCNLTGFQQGGAFTFLDLSPDNFLESTLSASSKNPLLNLYAKIRQAVRRHHASSSSGLVWVILDDASLLEVATGGSQHQVLDFVHYCRALSSQEQGLSLVLLVHKDLYDEPDPLSLVRGLEVLADVVLNVDASNLTGESDIRGMLTVIHRTETTGIGSRAQPDFQRVQSVRFELRDNSVAYTAL